MSLIRVAVSLVVLLALAPVADAYPTKPITIVVPWSAGGPADLMWRALAEPMSKTLGQPVLIVNKPGGAGALGTVMVKNAAPDGYTLGHVSTAAHLINPYTQDVGYQAADFTYLYGTVAFPLGLVVKADSPWKTYAEFLEHARSNPGKIRMGYAGTVGAAVTAMKWIAKKENIRLTEVIYKGDSEMVPAILGGHIDAIASAGGTIAHVKSGQLRLLMAFTSQPLKGFEQVPVARKLYGKGVESTIGLFGPKGLPREVVAKIEDAVAKSMSAPGVLKAAESISADVVNQKHEDFQAAVLEADRTIKEWLDDLGLPGKK